MSNVATIETDNEPLQVPLLAREEASLISQFTMQVDAWLAKHGEKAQTIEIVYYPDDDGFEIVNNEPNNGLLSRNRISIFRGELIAWATQQIQALKGWSNERSISEFVAVYRDGSFGVLCKTAAAS
ncbi:hypothetical protein SAMN02745664_1237 [Moraxella cuniculi DSM 21768]|uniref:Uncharacterized protein n=1 Tax=Moraxella cuniculi DSM 21768 TaxID=1122245 RepID=A0A1N7G3Y0_9GAMM|nr:hypothetical protein [Moraxella cuniculi]OOS03277.1 hypothetical protein B0189_09755 [Moraxella cuniculi]SIS07272.1 hypothetical protein SAMN02745664_1237 [Moraxella cuniculi DSM 21768]